MGVTPNQPAPYRGGRGPLVRLLHCSEWSLADWYATPLTPAEAGDWLSSTQQAIQQRLRSGEPCFPLQVLLQICRFWLDASHVPDSETLRPRKGSVRHAALPELVYGQLLASRKLRSAMPYLERGFRLAAPRLEAAAYFRLLREHELIACLPLSDTPAAPQDLPVLLNEAAVIRRLRRADRRRPICTHLDTLS